MITRRSLLPAATALLAAPGLIRPARAAGLSLDLATVWPDGNFHTANARRFAAEVAKATEDAVTINVQSGGALGFKGPEQLSAVRDGLVPMADILNNQQIGEEPMMAVESISFLVGSFDELRTLHKHLMPEYEKVAARNNQKFLYIVPWPTQYIHLKTPISSVDQLRGVRIRSSDKTTADMCNLLGGAGTMMPWGEVVPALASGRIEGVATSATSGVDGRFWEFLKATYRTNHTFSSQLVSINLDSWGQISPANRARIEEVAKRLQPEFWQVAADDDTSSVKKLTAGGMQVIDPSPEMMAEMRRRTVPIKEDFLKRAPAAKPVIAAYLAELGRS
ncbi:TRAP transporter substrate-binding protein [Roseomonas marmotae]|uniref:TRAP transporter substrate-binding protein n=1 Tax=Roseomonas marmotae TaxID=2768161 RepID=A0ABS3K6F6_9PROT|nr:TRAP transporter substrate-binding protein [Roseomonas marmotae]MBO1073036.1 TRAP transporter substrate-binding protein [Roseomonas marmotae]QTI79317.1 TRAP transporter substrate-binding protein [Roseomonas marmotae]